MTRRRPSTKRVKKAIAKLGKDAVRMRLAEHLYEAKLLEPSSALVFAEQILADLRPLLEKEAREAVIAERGLGPHYGKFTPYQMPRPELDLHN